MLSLAQLSPSLFDMLLTVIITVFYDNIEERTCAGWSGGWVLHTTQVQVTMGIKTTVMAKENIADIVLSPTSILIKSCFVYIHLSILLKYVQLLRLRGACKKKLRKFGHMSKLGLPYLPCSLVWIKISLDNCSA